MKEELLSILPKSIAELLERDWDGLEGKMLLDVVIEDANGYGYHPEEIVPCLHAAYYAYEATVIPDKWDKNRLVDVFIVGYRSALKLLSYGKYKAKRTESGWMKYEKLKN